MIAPIPERVLKLVTERDEPKVRTNSDVLPRDGMMRELIAQARRAGYNRDFIVDALDRLLLHGTMSDDMRTSIIGAVNAVAATSPLKRARTAAYLVLTSSQYQVER